MQIPQKQLKKFKEIYLAAFGVELTDEDVLRKATEVLNLFKIFKK